ncbi:MAG: hypothetical protein AAF968_01895 [Pseudomonadota bacterium]
MQSSTEKPWQWQLGAREPQPWWAGYPILALCIVLCLWYASLALRFTEGAALPAALIWVFAAAVWLGSQIALAREHLPERFAATFSTIVQAVLPVLATVVAAIVVLSFKDAVLSIASGVTVFELVAIHILRLAAWGTIAKYRQGQLPRYFYRFGSIPNFGFAITATSFSAALFVRAVQPSDWLLIAWSALGAVALLGAAISMYLGVPGSALSSRWRYVQQGREAPALLAFRWPMNLAPAFCGPAFWLAHGLLIVKVAAP